VLDTATGLGYTAIEAARTAEHVITIELDPAALEMARANPWSQALFTAPNIKQRIGDAFDVVETLKDETFHRIIHDPPAFSLAGHLYSTDFYRELYRVLRPGRRLATPGTSRLSTDCSPPQCLWRGCVEMKKEPDMTTHDGEFPNLKAAVIEAWNRKAAFWAQHMGTEGNAFHQTLVEPTAPRLLELQRGRFGFTPCHSAFNRPMMSQLLEEVDEEGQLRLKRSLRIWGYLTPLATSGVGMVGEPTPHYYFHRPLHLLLKHAFAVGLVVDGLEEAAFPPPAHDDEIYRPLGWQTMPDIPPVLGVRVRRMVTEP